MHRIALALGLGLVLSIPAQAFDPAPPSPRTRDNGGLRPSDDARTGKIRPDDGIPAPDGAQDQGPGSGGPVDGMTVGSGALSDMLSGRSGLGTAAFYGLLPGNSVAVNTARLQGAIAALGAVGGGTINFPCGDFSFTAIDNNV